MVSRILILGGYGTTGATLSELLLEHSDAEVVLAGRTLSKAEAAAAALGARYPGRVSARVADAADPASLERAFTGIDMVAVASSTLAHADTVMQAALGADVDYFDLQLCSAAKYEALERLRPRIESEGRCFITDGGIHPGLSAAMIRALEPAFVRLERAEVAGLMRVDWGSYSFAQSTIYEFALEMRDYRLEALRDGVWTRLDWRQATKPIDFGPPYGTEPCTTMYLEELRRLPETIPSLRTCGFYVSGFNLVVDRLLMPLGLLVMKAAPGTLGRPYARLLSWCLRSFGRPPYVTVWQLEAEGETTAGVQTAGLRVVHEDGYWLTAAAAAACLLQYMDGSLRAPGVHLQALVVDPARLLRDLRSMGARIHGYGVQEQAVLGGAPAAAG